MQSRSRCARGALPLAFSALLASALPAQQPAAAPARALTLQDAINLAQRQGLAANPPASARHESRAHDRAFHARLLPQGSPQGGGAHYPDALVGVLTHHGT